MPGEKDQSGHSMSVGDENNNNFFSYESGIPTDAPIIIDMVECTEVNFSDNPNKFKLRLVDTEQPLYKGCHNYTKLFVLVQLLNLKSKYRHPISSLMNYYL